MRFTPFIITAGLSAAASIPRQTSTCENPIKRTEWRELDPALQTQYINAVLCLKTKPSEIGLNTARYDDFPYVHTHLDKSIHTVAMFLPWHRMFVQVYEQALVNCGYTGPMPYWDWTLDTADVTRSPIWDPIHGFGGNGDPSVDPWTESSKKKCLVDGPLQGVVPAYTMGGYEPHCLARNWNNGTAFPGNMFAQHYTTEAVATIHALEDYASFRYQLEGGPHGAVHSAVGGDMMPATSPNDPIFFLHHTQVDRLWALWQQENPAARNMDFAGPKTQDQNTTEATLEDIMPFMGITPDIKVAEVMEIGTPRFCYSY
ncbi:hypothetical protein F5144DRAFT_161778 [Chaetomium tenue]|uniref:Uncharacterized protein n=1 Tax=Chaetomium tenue TaxID=1854479 RepID=A0ACB7PEA4_9PEZI|nr:hypothetical protein F5144DRAFT_161778 [Chaetomium globosum]